MSSDTRDHFKAVVLGDSGVGKTSLVSRWVRGTYDRQTTPTVGANHQRKRVTIDDKDVEVYLWDTAGQEQFQALTPLYSRMSSVAIIVASVDRAESFENVDQWYDQLRASSKDVPPVVMAVNKMDLYEDGCEWSVDKITKEFGSRFAGLFFVSAMTNQEVDNMFLCAAQVGYRFMMKDTEKDEPVQDLTAPNEPNSQSRCKC